MEALSSIFMGLQVACEPINLFFCFVGVTIGTLIGVLPGIGPLATLSILLPITFHAPPLSGIIMLAGVYYGAMYGGSTTSILVNIPGEAASVVTCLDGYQMARQGKAGPALGIAAFRLLHRWNFRDCGIDAGSPSFGPDGFAIRSAGIFFLGHPRLDHADLFGQRSNVEIPDSWLRSVFF